MDWVRGERLGYGSFAKVNLAVPTGKSSILPPIMAVKSCGVSHSSSLMREKLVLEELKGCPEIIRCFGESFSHENGEKLYNVLLEYASGGSLADKLKNSDHHRLPEFEVRQYTKALLKGLNDIHMFGYVHCDIKLQNVLLFPNGGVKIADFGLARRAGRKEGCDLRGTPMYMSPEMVSGSEQESPADIWALGCAVAEMVSGSPAWSCSDVAALLMRIGVGEKEPEIPGVLSEEGKDFLKKCFVKDPRQRWTTEMLLNHQFVCGLNFNDDINSVTASKDRQENVASKSPRCPFDFQDLGSSTTYSITSTSLSSPAESGLWLSEEPISPAERPRGLLSKQGPNWSVSGDWVTVRCRKTMYSQF